MHSTPPAQSGSASLPHRAPVGRWLNLDGLEIRVTDWAPEVRRTVVMWHGLARTGRDFDDLANALDGWRVLCPDTPGRGQSQWAVDPVETYRHGRYVRIAEAMLETLGVARVAWVGTSMGGAIGMVAAGGRLSDRIAGLVLNDIAPTVPAPALERIRAYAGKPPDFATLAEFEAFLRTVYAPFGPLTDAQWRRMAETSHRRRDDGRITVHYDPAIVRQFTDHPEDLDLWDAYDRIPCPTMLLRGVDTDIVPRDSAEAMTQRGPRCRWEEIDGCGHAPALNTPGQITLVRDFLEGLDLD